MIDLKNALEVINELFVLPIMILTFLLLIYVAYYLSTKDPDIIRSRIFLKYKEFKKAFILLAVFAFVLIIHVALIYIPHFYSFEDYVLIIYLQRFGGFLLSIIMITFALILIKSIK